MSRLMSVEERYERDPMFHALVMSLMADIEELELTPTEIREAAMLAMLKFEQRRITRPPKEPKDKFDPRDVAILGGDPSL